MADAFGRLLIVDDETAVLDVLAEYFTSQGHDVHTAQSGPEALDALGRVRPDLILLDIRMPGMDGVQVLRELRSRAATVPVVMVTANEDLALARLTLRLGAFDYVSKPFDFPYLDRAVTAGLLQVTPAAEPMRAPHRDEPPPSEEPPPRDEPKDAWKALMRVVFRVTRDMPAPGRAATGARMEGAVLSAAAEAAAGAPATARRALDELERLAWLAGELGDLGAAEREAIEAAVSAARVALSP
jgi:DNA-binding response OmpR family regulator